MELGISICNLGGTAESRVVFEPVTLSAEDIAEIFSDKKSKKFLSSFKFVDFGKLRGKLILIDDGVIAVCRQRHENNVFVLVKIIGKEEDFLMAYEVEDSTYKVYLEGSCFEICTNRFCRDSACWAVPVYILFPSLYPELCDKEVCKKFTNT